VDADLYILGSKDFMERNADLRRELAYLGKLFSDQEWYSGQLDFLMRHSYFTASARSLRDSQKNRNINHLREAFSSSRT
jgi:hypothetical protein